MSKSLFELKNFWIGKKVLITGHTGFKGTWLSIFLNLVEAKIYGYSLKPKRLSLFNQTNCSKLLEKNFYSNINNISNLKKKIQQIKPEIIFHLAAQSLVSDSYKNPAGTFCTNVMGTINLLEAVKITKSVKSVVIVTTDKVYKINNSNKSYIETDELSGKDPYSASKACAEISVNSYIESFFKKNFLSHRISTARSGNVLGGGDYSKNRLVPDIIKAINNNQEILVRNPEHVRPWQHVIEPIYGYLLLAQKQYEGKLQGLNHSWNFGPKKNNFVKVIQIIKIIKKIKKIVIKFKKSKIVETKILKLNSEKSIKHLEWRQKWNIAETLKKVMEWNDFSKKNKNLKKICEQQIANYFDG